MDNLTLISRIEAYCSKHGVKHSMFGRRAVNDGKLLPRLKDGRTITLNSLALIERQLGLPPDRSAFDERDTERAA